MSSRQASTWVHMCVRPFEGCSGALGADIALVRKTLKRTTPGILIVLIFRMCRCYSAACFRVALDAFPLGRQARISFGKTSNVFW